jgi:CheY-like chemotaxis protein
MRSTILVVEDNDLAREELTLTLRREGYEVVPARDGQEALDYLKAGPSPDLILLDMLMPVLDGWQFLKKTPQPSTPTIITTSTILTREWATTHGCAGFLHKPFDNDDLLLEVHRCLPSQA